MLSDYLAGHPLALTLLGAGGGLIVCVVVGAWLLGWWRGRRRNGSDGR